MRFAVLALVCACHPATPIDKPAPPPDPPLPLRADVRTGVLANGLTYYVLPHAAPAKRAYVWLVVKAGSVNEDDDQRGVAHFVEHLAFAGSKRFEGKRIEQYLSSIGMSLGADVNAHTTWDETTFELTVPTDKPEYADTALAMVRDFARDVSFDDAGIERERKIVREELRTRLGESRRVNDRENAVLFAGSRYAARPVLGLPEVIEHVSRDTIVRFYTDWYRPERMAVIVVGDIDGAAIEAKLRDELGTLPKPTTPARELRIDPPPEHPRVSIETDGEATGPLVRLGHVVRRHTLATRADFRRTVAEELYAKILAWRLSTVARRADSPFLAANADFETLTNTDTFLLWAFAKAGRVDAALRQLLVEQLRIQLHGLTPREVDLAKADAARRRADQATAAATADGRRLAGELARHFTTGELVIAPQLELDLSLQLTVELTPDDIAHVVDPYLTSHGLVVLVSGPDKSDLPDGDRIIKVLHDAPNSDVQAWKPPPDPKPLIAKAPTAGTITAETSLDAIGAVEWKLSNGARVVIKRTDFAAGTFELRAVAPGGLAMSEDADLAEASYATEVAMAGGAGALSRFEVANALSGKTARATPSLELESDVVSAGGATRDAEAVLQLVYLRMAQPRKDDKALAVWKANLPERVDNTRRRPEVAFDLDANALLYQNNVRRNAFDHARLAALDVDKAFAIYQARFGDASGFTFVIVGDIDPKVLRPLVERYLASLPSLGHTDTPPDRKVRKASGVLAKTWTRGHEPKAQVLLDFHGDVAWSGDAANDLEVLRHVVELRLREVLREDKGGVYNVGVGASLSRRGERDLAIRFACDPTRVDELVQATLDELAALHKGVSDELLANLKASYARARETELRDNAYWLDALANAYRDGGDPAHLGDDVLTARMTADRVRAAAATFADPAQYARFVLAPEP